MSFVADFTVPDPTENFANWATGQFDGIALNAKERQSVQHLREELRELKRKADAITIVRLGLIGSEPDHRQQEFLKSRTFDLHHTAYSTIGATAAVFARTVRYIDPALQVPAGMVDDFLKWLEKWDGLPELSTVIKIARSSRDYRNVFAHPQQRQSLDWFTQEMHAEGPAVILFGGTRNPRQIPVGAVEHQIDRLKDAVLQRHDEEARHFWLAAPPNEQALVNALLNLVAMFASRASGAVWARAAGKMPNEPEQGLDRTTLPLDAAGDDDA